MYKQGALKGFRWGGRMTGEFPGFWRFVWSTNLSAHPGSRLHPCRHPSGRPEPRPGPGGPVPHRAADRRRPGQAGQAGGRRPLSRTGAAVGRQRPQGPAQARPAGRLARGGSIATVILLVAAFAGAPLLGLILGSKFEAAGDLTTWLVAAAAIGIWALPLEPLLISTNRAGRSRCAFASSFRPSIWARCSLRSAIMA